MMSKCQTTKRFGVRRLIGSSAVALGLVLLASGVCLTESQAADPPTDDLSKMQGTWVADRVEADGKNVEAMRGLKAVINGEQISSQAGSEVSNAKLRIDATKLPREIDVIDSDGRQTLGIYLLAGDTLQVCATLPLAGARRPNEFVTNEGDGRILFVYKRVR